jgi:hypothetical protein
MSVPDYILPLVGYRVWTWGTMGLKSLSGVRWHPNQSLAGRCRASTVTGTGVGRAEAADHTHDAPQENCTCGVYAVKTLHHFRSAGYERFGIHGEVYLWGRVVEHEVGYRAQFAYPKTFVLMPDALPFTLAEIWPRLQALTLFGSDIFVLRNEENTSLWSKSSGFDPVGLDCLIEIGKEYYVRCQRDRILKRGDRLTVLGRGTAVVEHVDGEWIQAVVLNKCTLRIARKCVRWDRQYMRWETSPLACVETKAKA